MVAAWIESIGLFQKLDAHPLTKTWESPKMGILKHLFGCKGKENMGIAKIFDHFQ